LDKHDVHKGALLVVLRITLVVLGLQLLVAVTSKSLMMWSDTFHLFIHVIACIVAYTSEFKFLGFPPGKIKKYTALTNIGLFFVTGAVIFNEALGRLFSPPELNINLFYFIIAGFGFVANVYTTNLLDKIEGHDECSSNIKPLRWCMIVDAISSGVVIFGAIAITLTKQFVLDPMLSFVLVVFMVWKGYRMARDTIRGHAHTH